MVPTLTMNLFKYNFTGLKPSSCPQGCASEIFPRTNMSKVQQFPQITLIPPFQDPPPPAAVLSHKSSNLPDGTILQAFGQIAFCKLCIWTNSTKPLVAMNIIPFTSCTDQSPGEIKYIRSLGTNVEKCFKQMIVLIQPASAK